jgi:hypothetical protein
MGILYMHTFVLYFMYITCISSILLDPNNSQKTKPWEIRCSGGVGSSCSTSDTRHVTDKRYAHHLTDFKAPNLPLSLRLKVSGCHYNSSYNNTWTKQVKQL